MARREEENEKLARIRTRRTIHTFTAAALLLALGGLAVLLGKDAAFVGRYYRPFSRFVMNILAWITGLVPFSAAELLLYCGALALLVCLVRLVWILFSGPGWAGRLCALLSKLALAGGIGVFMFYGLWAQNYNAPPLADTLGLNALPRTGRQLYELNVWLTARANALSELVERGEDGRMTGARFTDTARAVADEFEKTTGRPEIRAKYVLASKPMSYTQITGIFIPFTGEANVNSNNTPSALPFTMAHEMAHRYGIAREDEANFYAFYVLRDSDDPELAYSAVMCALRYCQSALWGADAELAAEISASFSAALRGDYAEYSAHWKQYEGKVAEVSSAVNNTYLQQQGQADGEKSYGRMVDLMLGWYEAEKS